MAHSVGIPMLPNGKICFHRSDITSSVFPFWVTQENVLYLYSLNGKACLVTRDIATAQALLHCWTILSWSRVWRNSKLQQASWAGWQTNIYTWYGTFTWKYSDVCFRYYIKVYNLVLIFARKYNLLAEVLYLLFDWAACSARAPAKLLNFAILSFPVASTKQWWIIQTQLVNPFT